jgi:DNA-binding MarR family transcriptional regulator
MEKTTGNGTTEGFPADDIVPPILHAAAIIERLSDRHIFEPAGLSLTAFRILALLDHTGPTPSTRILETTGGTKSNLSQRLGMLARKGFVRRIPAPSGTDRRITPFRITPAGRRKLRETERLARDAGIRLSGLFSERELATHRAFFRKLLSLLDRAGSHGCTECVGKETGETGRNA